MDARWKPWVFETFPAGASSAVSPDLLPDGQVAWGMNVSFRGAKVRTRPNIAHRLILPPGLLQGASYFGVQGGMIVAMIAGQAYRVRISENDFSYELINLPDPPGINSPVFNATTLRKEEWLQIDKTVE